MYLEDKEMKLDKEMSKVVADLEYCLGKECYNGSSYDGYTGTQGCSFRYPVNLKDSDGEDLKIRTDINSVMDIRGEEVDNDDISTMKYKFGANSLYVGRGLVNVLDYLEDRYDLDFNVLEKGLAE